MVITGASGFIGSHLVSSLYPSSSYSNAHQHEIICMTRTPESIGRLAAQVKVIKGDVSNNADLLKGFGRNRCGILLDTFNGGFFKRLEEIRGT